MYSSSGYATYDEKWREGNYYFGRREYDKAEQCYREALEPVEKELEKKRLKQQARHEYTQWQMLLNYEIASCLVKSEDIEKINQAHALFKKVEAFCKIPPNIEPFKKSCIQAASPPLYLDVVEKLIREVEDMQTKHAQRTSGQVGTEKKKADPFNKENEIKTQSKPSQSKKRKRENSSSDFESEPESSIEPPEKKAKSITPPFLKSSPVRRYTRSQRSGSSDTDTSARQLSPKH